MQGESGRRGLTQTRSDCTPSTGFSGKLPPPLRTPAGSGAVRLGVRMGRPPLEEPGPQGEPGGGLLQSRQRRVRGANNPSHLYWAAGVIFPEPSSIPSTSGPRSPRHQASLEAQGAWASRQRAFPFTCAGECARAVPLSMGASSLHTSGALISPLLLQASFLGVRTQACPRDSEVAAASQSPSSRPSHLSPFVCARVWPAE